MSQKLAASYDTILGMAKKIIVGNWKMYPLSFKKAKEVFSKIKKKTAGKNGLDVIICPSFLFLESFARNQTSRVSVGAQDVSAEKEGAFTGGVSALALYELGVRSVIIGHSERRETGDDNDTVAKKVKQALTARLRPIICIGEKERDMEGAYLGFLKEQITSALSKTPPALLKLITIAYEPVWAIGKEAKEAATPADFLEKSIFIRRVIADLYDQKIATTIQIIYGGSVDETNAISFFSEGKAQGLLVGRASLNPDSFGDIIKAVSNL